MLAELYAAADVAFVGGGFHAAGLHSVLEPAAFGVPVAFGPRHANSRDAELLLSAGGAAAAGPAGVAVLAAVAAAQVAGSTVTGAVEGADGELGHNK